MSCPSVMRILIAMTLCNLLPVGVPLSQAGEASIQPAGSTEITQARVDAAMERLRQRQRARQTQSSVTSTSQPTSTQRDWPAEGKYTQANVQKMKAAAIAGCYETIRIYSKTSLKNQNSRDEIAKAKSRREALRNTSLERYRDLLIECDEKTAAETERQRQLWVGSNALRKIVDNVRKQLSSSDSIRSVQIDWSSGTPTFSSKGCELALDCTFDYVTKSDLVRNHKGWIEVDAYWGNGITVWADIDGSMNRRNPAARRPLNDPDEWPYPFPVNLYRIADRDGMLFLAESVIRPPTKTP